MKQTILLLIEDQNQKNVEAAAFSKDTANIYIYAATIQEAAELLPKGAELAAEAMKNWTPEAAVVDQPEDKPVQHYVHYTYSIEEMADAAEAYENTPAGQRFTKRLENARAFYYKHSKGGLLCSEVQYLAFKHQNGLINGGIDLSALAYRRGYRAGKEAAKK